MKGSVALTLATVLALTGCSAASPAATMTPISAAPARTVTTQIPTSQPAVSTPKEVAVTTATKPPSEPQSKGDVSPSAVDAGGVSQASFTWEMHDASTKWNSKKVKMGGDYDFSWSMTRGCKVYVGIFSASDGVLEEDLFATERESGPGSGEGTLYALPTDTYYVNAHGHCTAGDPGEGVGKLTLKRSS